MKVLLLHQYFKIPEEGGCIRSYYLAKGLLEQGHQVELITAHNAKVSQTKMVEGMLVHYLPVYYDNHLTPGRRLIAFAKFVYRAIKKARKLSGVDICYAMSTPLSIGLVALYLKKALKLQYIFEVGDLWPEAPIQMGLIKNRWLANGLYRFERAVYQNAQQLVALSPPIEQSMRLSAPGSKVAVVTNMSDCVFFQKEAKQLQQENALEVTGRFVVTYFGAAGKANHLDFLLESAQACQTKCPKVVFLVLAHGSELDRIKHLAKQRELQNLKFLGYRNKQGLKEVLNVTDAVYISYADYPILQTGSPNRFFDGLAAGKLILLNFGGWLREITESNQCGFYTDPHRPDALVEQLEPFLKDPDLLDRYQSNARRLAEQRFSREDQIKKFLILLGSKLADEVEVKEAYSRSA